MKRPPVVVLCGSTRFAEVMNREAERLTLAGAIVVRPEVIAYDQGRDPQLHDPATKAALDELHLRKIDLADRVLVVNPFGYIGESTTREIRYAEKEGKPLDWLLPHTKRCEGYNHLCSPPCWCHYEQARPTPEAIAEWIAEHYK